jgi:hypothetical protein
VGEGLFRRERVGLKKPPPWGATGPAPLTGGRGGANGVKRSSLPPLPHFQPF